MTMTMDEFIAETRAALTELPVRTQAEIDQRTAELRGELERIGVPITRDTLRAVIAVLLALLEWHDAEAEEFGDGDAAGGVKVLLVATAQLEHEVRS